MPLTGCQYPVQDLVCKDLKLIGTVSSAQTDSSQQGKHFTFR